MAVYHTFCSHVAIKSNTPSTSKERLKETRCQSSNFHRQNLRLCYVSPMLETPRTNTKNTCRLLPSLFRELTNIPNIPLLESKRYGMVFPWYADPLISKLDNGPWNKSLNFIVSTNKYVIPKTFKFSHWPSKNIVSILHSPLSPTHPNGQLQDFWTNQPFKVGSLVARAK